MNTQQATTAYSPVTYVHLCYYVNGMLSIPELVFNAFNGQCLKIAIGKGKTILQEIQNLLNRYMGFFE
ncbi:MAG: hypothetical protein E7338_00495 [Clostridiales bacterium]|nr:hypothetical protein [Clostridiales bacterium]